MLKNLVGQVQPNELCRQMVHPSVDHPWLERLSPPRNRGHWRVPCIATVCFILPKAMVYIDTVIFFRRGVPSRLVIFTDEGHHVSKSANRYGSSTIHSCFTHITCVQLEMAL